MDIEDAMKNYFNKLLIGIVSLLNLCIPKKKIITFYSFPDVSDNAYAFFHHIALSNSEYKIIWLIKNFDNVENIKKKISKKCYLGNTKFIKKDSLKGVYYFVVSKYVFFTHGIYNNVKIPRRQTVVNLWHGMPLKKIGILDNKDKSEVVKFTYIISTSDLFKNILAQAFGINEKKVLVFGSPRYDLLFYNNDVLNKLNIKKSIYKKVLIWMPTYRISKVGDIRSEGKVSESGLPLLNNKDLVNLNNFLKEINNICIIKLHPMDRVEKYSFTNLDNIKFINNEDLININEQLNSLLAQADVLLTDYSSVYFDFLLLNRPIGFIHEDVKEYDDHRGFILEPINYWTPGEKISSFDNLKAFIIDINNGVDNYKKKREEVNNKVNKYCDNKNSERLKTFLRL